MVTRGNQRMEVLMEMIGRLLEILDEKKIGRDTMLKSGSAKK